MLLAFTGIFASDRVGRFIGTRIEDAIDSWQELSYIKLNRGDDKEIETAKEKNRNSIIKALSNVIYAILIGVFATVIADWIVHKM